MTGKIQCKRIYEAPAADVGLHVPACRLWPRNIRQAEAAIEPWIKYIAPSLAL